MSSLYLLIPLSLPLIALAAYFLWRAIDGRQFENLDEQQRRPPD